jgi:hypothetical protein
VASCPTLAPLADGEFATVTRKLAEVADQYAQCRAAAIAGERDAD